MHYKYKTIKDNPMGVGERNILQGWVDGLVDRDNKMVQEFQKTFHSSFWEFYLFACFKEAGFRLNQQYNRPDFIIEAPNKFVVEAVVANIKNKGRQEAERNLDDLLNMFVPPRKQYDFHTVLDEAVVRQSNAISSKIKKYRNEYTNCKWVEEDNPFVIAISSYSQVNYGREYIYPMMALLYGMYYIPETDTYETRETILKPDTDAAIPIGLFCTESYRDVSAILYSCTTTLGKLTSLSISRGDKSVNSVYNLRRDYEDSRIPYKLQKVSKECPELLSDGLFLFHNPYAKNKLDIKCFESSNVTQYFWKNNKLFHTNNTYPIICRLNFPSILEKSYRQLIDEYVRQYNNFSPIEAYSLDPAKKIAVDFYKDCIVCVWVVMKESQVLRNIHYTRPQFMLDSSIEREALQIVSNYSNIEYISRIDIVRTYEELLMINQ